jgi:L-2,4-diaminobutyric acid acetyltransferase
LDVSGCASSNARERAPAIQGQGLEHRLRAPTADDGRKVAELIAACAPLDPNSLYCNLLQCTHFAGTCIIAEREGALEGWISGYRPPDEPEAMFVWQVAVHERARGTGLAVTMLDALFERPEVAGANWLKTTVSPSNLASRRMFAKFAQSRGAQLKSELWFDRHRHFGGHHESEELLVIGPLSRHQFSAQSTI